MLGNADVAVQAHYCPAEGHGFCKIENERDFWGRLLTFLQKHIGDRPPAVAAVPAKE